ncbi:MAG: HAD family hydrolase [Acidobacteriota bacterium]|nr:HAD family hydrolase [Acidobacteriota bacterium]
MKAVFFDVDFTLIYPGPALQAEGHRTVCDRHGVAIDPSRWEAAVRGASSLLHSGDQLYDARIFIDYTAKIIEGMGGAGQGVDAASREIYDEWAVCHHFSLYDDVAETLMRLHHEGYRIGLISNTHRCLTSFQSHFALDGLIAAAVSSSAHGYMKPHASIFQAALTLAGVTAEESVMVGDSYAHDIAGAEAIGMRGILIARGPHPAESPSCPVISSLGEIFEHL